jgi:hypothetical protein
MTIQLRQEPTTLTGANFTGADGDQNREYALTYTSALSAGFTIIVGGLPLQPDVHYTLISDVVKVLGKLYNESAVSINYCTGTSGELTYTSRLEDTDLTGAGFTGADGSTNRTFNLTYSGATNSSVIKGGVPLQLNITYTLSGNMITILIPLYNSEYVTINYFTQDAISTTVKTYCSTTDVYRTGGLTSSQVNSIDVQENISEAEVIICRYTKNIYWKRILDEQTADDGGDTSTLKMPSGTTWEVNVYAGCYVWIYDGTGKNTIRKIASNTADTLTFDRVVTAANVPDDTSKFRIFYVPSEFNPNVDESYDGSGYTYQYLPKYPIVIIETLAIASTNVSVSNIYNYSKSGKIQLKSGAEYTRFSRTYPQEVAINYWYGIDHLPLDIRRLVELQAAIQSLSQYMMSVSDKPSNVGLPEMTITNPQAYQVAKETLNSLKYEFDEKMKQVKVWPVFAF